VATPPRALFTQFMTRSHIVDFSPDRASVLDGLAVTSAGGLSSQMKRSDR
jgi:hypothetical protein